MPDGQNRHEEAPSTKVKETCLDNAIRVRFLIIKKIRCGKKLIELQDHQEYLGRSKNDRRIRTSSLDLRDSGGQDEDGAIQKSTDLPRKHQGQILRYQKLMHSPRRTTSPRKIAKPVAGGRIDSSACASTLVC